jgi:dsDNA-specific endonuclease/ATPase MutS2
MVKCIWSLELQGVEEHQELQMAVSQAIGEDGTVRDNASDEVSRTRTKVQTLDNRLRKLLQGMSGEVVEYVRHPPPFPEHIYFL